MKGRVKVDSYIIDRRESEDRRSFESPGIVPIININGKVIHHDRRCTPDRRIANIHVEEYTCDIDDEFFINNFRLSAS